MSKMYKTTLSNTDWNEEWKELQRQRRNADNAGYWDKRSHTYGKSDQPSTYVESFIKKSGIMPGESVFDMGCGTGALSIPLASQGHTVIAADFSQGMLSRLEEEKQQRGLDAITTKIMSWSDDWTAAGVSPKSVDIAFASRSIATANLKDSLLRLNAVARRKACITITTGSSPRIDNRIIKAAGISSYAAKDFQYALNILINEGFFPELSYIVSTRKDTFDSFNDALNSFTEMLAEIDLNSDTDPNKAREKLALWLKKHLVTNPEEGVKNERGVAQKAFCLDSPRSNTWAFISWETNEATA